MVVIVVIIFHRLSPAAGKNKTQAYWELLSEKGVHLNLNNGSSPYEGNTLEIRNPY